VLQQSCRGFTGLSGPGRASVGLVCPWCSVRSMTAAWRWRWAPPAQLRSCCPLSRRCRVPPPYRPCAIGLEEMGMLNTRSWWRLQVGGEAWWWHSFASELFFVGGGQEKSLSACSTLTRCRFRVTPFLPEGRHGKPPSTLLRAGGNPRTFWSGQGQQHRVNGASLLEGAAWLWALWSTWSVVGKVGGRSGCGSSSLRRFAVVFISFCFGHVFAVAPAFSVFETRVSVWLLYNI
jgi:hypothetical protein